MKEYIKFGLVGLLSGVLVIVGVNILENMRINDSYVLFAPGIIFGLCIGIFMVVNPTTKTSLVSFLKILIASAISYYSAFYVAVAFSENLNTQGVGEINFFLGGLTGAFVLSLGFFRKSQPMFLKIGYFTLLGGVVAYISTLIGLGSDAAPPVLYLIWQTVMTLAIYHLFIRKENN